MSTATTLKSYREQAGLSQTDLARQIGVTQSLISHYERGIKIPTARIAVAIEKATRGGIHRATLRPDLFE